eukprot:NP_491445.3 Uncharacterized protein CELE_M04F3.2 [Caenorhabditis elegans]
MSNWGDYQLGGLAPPTEPCLTIRPFLQPPHGPASAVVANACLHSGQQDAEETEVKEIRENATRKQGATTGQVEEVENQTEKDREIVMNRERNLKRANEEWGTTEASKRPRYEDSRGVFRGGFRGRREARGGFRRSDDRGGFRGRDGGGGFRGGQGGD